MSETTEFVLPETVTKSTGKNARDLVIISQPKMGKSCILGDFSVKYNGIILNLEKGGYEYIDATKIDIHENELTSEVEAFFTYIKIRDLLLKNKGKYDFLIIDGLSDLDKMSELGGTLLYMNSIIGKKFNRLDKGIGAELKPSDPRFKSVLTLADGAGYKHTRDWFLQQIEIFRQISPYRIYAAHVADKYIKDTVSREEVVGQELFLTGKLKNIFATKVTALGKLIAEDSKRFINFEVLNDSIIAGSRAPNLKGKLEISSSQEGIVFTYWENIYSKELLTKINKK